MKKILVSILLLASFSVYSQTFKEIRISKLPKAANDYITQAVPGATVIKAAQGTQNGQVYYGAVAEGRGRKFCFIFDNNGNFIEKVDNLSKFKALGSTSTIDSPTTQQKPAGTGKPDGYRDLPLQSCPVNAQKYINTKHPNGKVISSGQYSLKGQGFFLVVVRENNLDYNLHFTSKGNYLPKSSKITPSMPASGTQQNQQPTTKPPSKRRAPGSDSDPARK